MTVKKPLSTVMPIGLMLFALFFGAGNLIFPPALGQNAGENLWPAIIGFLLTGVGLPLLGVLAIGISGSKDSQAMASRVHPVFAVIFMFVIYLTIGPFFAIPRTGAVVYEIAVKPFLPLSHQNNLSLFIESAIFFGITCWLSLNPGKLVDRIGKVLTPMLILVLILLVIQPIISPMGTFIAAKPAYQTFPFFKGFQEGYLTMDTLASIVFGIVVINAIRDQGITDTKKITSVCCGAGLIAAVCLASIYVSLAYIGARSTATLGHASNGGILLSQISSYYYGAGGKIVLGFAIFFACLTTSVGLVSSCASYFEKWFPRLGYKGIAVIVSAFSMAVSNQGLLVIISFSVPVLVALYPLAIVLIALVFLERFFGRRHYVYVGSIVATGLVSISDGIQEAGLQPEIVHQFLQTWLPFYSKGFGWLLPAAAGALTGYLISRFADSKIKEKSSIKDKRRCFPGIITF
jgi:branched-chain amino acid:cation transporter, LIVCS family